MIFKIAKIIFHFKGKIKFYFLHLKSQLLKLNMEDKDFDSAWAESFGKIQFYLTIEGSIISVLIHLTSVYTGGYYPSCTWKSVYVSVTHVSTLILFKYSSISSFGAHCPESFVSFWHRSILKIICSCWLESKLPLNINSWFWKWSS